MNDYGMLTKIYAQIHTYIIPSYIHTHLHAYTDTYVDTGLITSIYATMHAYRKNVLEKMPYGVMSWTNVGEKMSGGNVRRKMSGYQQAHTFNEDALLDYTRLTLHTTRNH